MNAMDVGASKAPREDSNDHGSVSPHDFEILMTDVTPHGLAIIVALCSS